MVCFFAEIYENLNTPPLFACRLKAFIFRRNLRKIGISSTLGMQSIWNTHFFAEISEKFEHFLTHLALQVESSQFFAEISENLSYPPLFACIRRVKAFIFRRNLWKFELSNTHGMHSFFAKISQKMEHSSTFPFSHFIYEFIYFTHSFFHRNLRKRILKYWRV